jgi:toxoflavin synthase
MAQYDTIGERFRRFKNTADLPVPESHLFASLIGDLTGVSVLDLACGHGHYTQVCLDAGAKRAVGVDISAAMIEQAKAAVPAAVFSIGDAEELPPLGAFDVVTAVWLFNYAESPDALQRMFASVGRNLAPGGRLVAITVHPEFDPGVGGWEPYGLRVAGYRSDALRDEMDCDLLAPGDLIGIHISRWAYPVYEQAAEHADMDELKWHLPKLPEQADRPRPAGYWDACVSNPFIVGMTARKP